MRSNPDTVHAYHRQGGHYGDPGRDAPSYAPPPQRQPPAHRRPGAPYAASHPPARHYPEPPGPPRAPDDAPRPGTYGHSPAAHPTGQPAPGRAAASEPRSAPSLAMSEEQPAAPSCGFESVDARTLASLRWQVGSRLKTANTGHLSSASLKFGTREARGPHALLLFFVSDAPNEPGGRLLHTASRLFRDGPDAAHLPTLLDDLIIAARGHIAAVGAQWHPLDTSRSMVNGGDVHLPVGARYLGVGVSTLDTDQGRWSDIAPSLHETLAAGIFGASQQISGRCYARLVDHTAMQVDRDAYPAIGDNGIRCTHPVDIDHYDSYRRYADLTSRGDHDNQQMWQRLSALHDLLTAHLNPGRDV